MKATASILAVSVAVLLIPTAMSALAQMPRGRGFPGPGGRQPSAPRYISGMTPQMSAKMQTQVGDLSGDVFIITKGRTNLKLALVTVTAIPEDAVQRHLVRKTVQSDEEFAKAQPEIDAAQREYAALVDEFKRAAAERADNAKLEELNRQQHLCLARKRDALGRQEYFRSAEFFYEGLPRGIASAKTDPDGRFVMRLPRRGKVAVAAHSFREIGDTAENYFWLVWVDTRRLPTRLLLSNDNMMGEGSPESAWK